MPMRHTAQRITLGVVGEGPVQFELPDADVKVHRWSKDVAAFEHPTLRAVQQYARQHPDAAVLYLNCLGGRHVGVGWPTRVLWRSMLLYLLVENYTLALQDHNVNGATFLPVPLP